MAIEMKTDANAKYQASDAVNSAENKRKTGPPPEDKRLPMVGWYDPRQLARTGIEVAISTIFGRHSDHRLVEAMASGDDQEEFYDYTCYYEDNGADVCQPDQTKPRQSIWIDYVGDVGDGWNSTYAVAYHLAEAGRTFTYTDRTGKQYRPETKRGEVLIFGGDEVYPTASRAVYNERLVAPYETALRYTSDAHPHVFAIPGNHDWYDSLVAFTRLFTARRWFAGWRTRQSRSYFALKLPHNWWLLGTDVQLGSDIDGPQMAYFQNLTTEMDKEKARTNEPARIILCHAEPHWIRAALYGGVDPNYNESNLKALESKLGRTVAVFIAGDLHHYRRHESTDRSTQKITAGGGGAFLHPTHPGLRGTDLDEITEKGQTKDKEKGQTKETERVFKLQGCFPSTKDSRRLCWRNLIFPYLNRTFGIVTAVLYLLLTLSVVARLNDPDMPTLTYQFGSITAVVIESALNSTPALFLILFTIVGFIFFTDTHYLSHRLIMGGAHGVAHVLAAFFIALVSLFIVTHLSAGAAWRFLFPFGGVNFYLDTRILLASLLVLIGGYIFGALIMGVYLLVSLNIFGRHSNEAFSSLAIEDWKNFLRLHIDERGDLTIYPIGIRRVPRKWRPRQHQTGPELEPDDPNATEPELIEPPIVMQRAETDSCVQTSSQNLKIDTSTQSSKPT